MNVAAHHNTVVGPRIGQGVGAGAGAAAHIKRLAGKQVSAQPDLAQGFNHDAGVTVIGRNGAAKELALDIVMVNNLAAGHQLAVDQRVLLRTHINFAVVIGGGNPGSARQPHANAVSTDAPYQLNAVVGAHGGADFNQFTGSGALYRTHIQLAAGLQVNRGVF